MGLTVDTTKGKVGAKPQISDFSPMTPGKGIAVRFGVNKGNSDALKSSNLPQVTSVTSPSGGGGAGSSTAHKSSFYKKSIGG
jgi:hypothetical protein